MNGVEDFMQWTTHATDYPERLERHVIEGRWRLTHWTEHRDLTLTEAVDWAATAYRCGRGRVVINRDGGAEFHAALAERLPEIAPPDDDNVSDRATIRRIFDDRHVEYWLGRAQDGGGVATLTTESGDRHVDGYSSFFTVFRFTESDDLLGLGAWE